MARIHTRSAARYVCRRNQANHHAGGQREKQDNDCHLDKDRIHGAALFRRTKHLFHYAPPSFAACR
jgi:hypothetical protein